MPPCFLGFECLSGNAEGDTGKPYGCHTIYNQFGRHSVLNNQYDGALAETCKSLTTDCHFTIGPQEGFYVNLTPINSILLREYYQ
ncbi:hypothetical protein ACFQ6E_11880 [Streptomyces sp. NPDC056462]|uniref:hypothetical protein n=1 Tax=Streptomyces sp. NPDC056462 TaxID=3345826 RepID=UPI0036A5DA7E